MARIAFIGLGNMGLPMARNLLKAGHTLSGFDLVQATVAQLASEGARAATSARDAASSVDAVISMLPAGRQVEELYLGEEGLLAALPADCLVLECSTIAPSAARRVHRAAAAHGVAMLDAPVSGGTAGAAAGSLTFMIGGAAQTLERALPLFLAMGHHLFHAGADGAGQLAKLCNNLLLAVQMIGTAEAMALGTRCGLDASVLAEIMRQSSGGRSTGRPRDSSARGSWYLSPSSRPQCRQTGMPPQCPPPAAMRPSTVPACTASPTTTSASTGS